MKKGTNHSSKWDKTEVTRFKKGGERGKWGRVGEEIAVKMVRVFLKDTMQTVLSLL